MAICSHCGRESQADAVSCQFCGYPLTARNSAISARDTIYATPPEANGQHAELANTIQSGNDGALATVIVRPLQGDDSPREFALTGQNISIGRSPSCEIVLEHDHLTSRRHALLRYDGARYTVVDLGSSNGTFVNDNEIRDATPLNNGDRIIVGEHVLTFSTSVGEAASIARVDMNGAPPSSPLSDTGEKAAVNQNDQQPAQSEQPEQPEMSAPEGSIESYSDTTAEADTNYMPTIMSPAEADTNYMPTIMPSAEATPAATADQANVSDTSDIADVSEAGDTITSMTAEPAEPAPLPPPSTPDSPGLLVRAPSSGALRQPGGELDQLRTQLAQLAATSEAVAQHAAQETDLSEQRRQALAETRDQLHAILAGMQNASREQTEPDVPGDLNDLIALSQQAAADPNHLQNVSRLAERASEIAQALEALQAHRIQPPRPTPEETALEELRSLQARLDKLA